MIALCRQRRLAVHPRQVQEGAPGHLELEVAAARDRLLREGERERVVREGGGRVAVDVAGELVEHDHLGQPPPRRRAPVVKLAAGRRCEGRTESLGDAPVECRVLAPPVRGRQLAEPELQHLVR